jgi:hypothetical protein
MPKRKSFSDKVFVSLKNKIARLDKLKTVNHLLSNIHSDFTRDRKLPFDDVIMIILSMAGCPIREELLDYFDYDINTATSSAFVQATLPKVLSIHSFLFDACPWNVSSQCSSAHRCARANIFLIMKTITVRQRLAIAFVN